MSLYRSRRHQKRWKNKWPWKRLFPLRVDEKVCPECRMPYHHGPLPDVVAQCFVHDVAVLIFPAGNFRRNEYTFRVGRWKIGGKQFYCSEFIPASDIDNVLAVVQMAQEKIAELSQQNGKRRSV